MTNERIIAVGRITGGNIHIDVAPSLHERSLSAARWYGAQDAARGETCNPGKYFSTDSMKDAYIAGYHA